MLGGSLASGPHLQKDEAYRSETVANRIEDAAIELRGAAAELLPRTERLEELAATWNEEHFSRLQKRLEETLEASVRKAFAEASELRGGVLASFRQDVSADKSGTQGGDGPQAALGWKHELPTVEPWSPGLPEQETEEDDHSEDENGRKSFESYKMEHCDPEPDVLDLLPDIIQFACLRRAVESWSNLVEPHRSGIVARLLESQQFELLCTTVIIFNALFAAYSADYGIAHINKEAPRVIAIIEWGLLAFYIVEITLRVSVHRGYYLCNTKWGWNLCDLFLVAQSLYENIFLALFYDTSGGGQTFMRIFRLLKLVKIMRVIKVVRAFRELRMMLGAVKNSLSALFWALIMLVFFLYVFALVFVHGFTTYLIEHSDNVTPYESDQVMEHFGSVATTVVSMYKAGLGGDDWSTYYSLASRVHWSYGMLFLFYIAFFQFTVTNILTGIIVENIVALGADDEENVAMEFHKRHIKDLRKAETLFSHIDMNHSGYISLEEFSRHSESNEVQALMSSIDLDIRDAEVFFRMLLGSSDNDKVCIKTFVDGCFRLRGSASAIDLQCLFFEVRIVRRMLMESCEAFGISLQSGTPGPFGCGTAALVSANSRSTAQSGTADLQSDAPSRSVAL